MLSPFSPPIERMETVVLSFDSLRGVIVLSVTLNLLSVLELDFIVIASTLFNATLLMALPAAITLFKLVSDPDLLYVTTASVYVFSRALSSSSV